MRVAAIPDAEVFEGHERFVMGPPEGHDPTGDVRACEMLRQLDASLGTMLYRARVVLEDGDLERLAAGEAFWVTFWGAVVPFDVAMLEVET